MSWGVCERECVCGGGGISTLLVFPCKKVWELNNLAEMCLPACRSSYFKAAAAALLDAGLQLLNLPA